jgi:hypothetical protein
MCHLVILASDSGVERVIDQKALTGQGDADFFTSLS